MLEKKQGVRDVTSNAAVPRTRVCEYFSQGKQVVIAMTILSPPTGFHNYNGLNRPVSHTVSLADIIWSTGFKSI